jgi:hypothetical protein
MSDVKSKSRWSRIPFLHLQELASKEVSQHGFFQVTGGAVMGALRKGH